MFMVQPWVSNDASRAVLEENDFLLGQFRFQKRV
jgi:hypothetical protein